MAVNNEFTPRFKSEITSLADAIRAKGVIENLSAVLKAPAGELKNGLSEIFQGIQRKIQAQDKPGFYQALESTLERFAEYDTHFAQSLQQIKANTNQIERRNQLMALLTGEYEDMCARLLQQAKAKGNKDKEQQAADAIEKISKQGLKSLNDRLEQVIQQSWYAPPKNFFPVIFEILKTLSQLAEVLHCQANGLPIPEPQEENRHDQGLMPYPMPMPMPK